MALLTILNCLGHCISYDEVKRLETEIAYTCSDGGRETPAGLNLHRDLGTGNTGFYCLNYVSFMSSVYMF